MSTTPTRTTSIRTRSILPVLCLSLTSLCFAQAKPENVIPVIPGSDALVETQGDNRKYTILDYFGINSESFVRGISAIVVVTGILILLREYCKKQFNIDIHNPEKKSHRLDKIFGDVDPKQRDIFITGAIDGLYRSLIVYPVDYYSLAKTELGSLRPSASRLSKQILAAWEKIDNCSYQDCKQQKSWAAAHAIVLMNVIPSGNFDFATAITQRLIKKVISHDHYGQQGKLLISLKSALILARQKLIDNRFGRRGNIENEDVLLEFASTEPEFKRIVNLFTKYKLPEHIKIRLIEKAVLDFLSKRDQMDYSNNTEQQILAARLSRLIY